VVNQQLVASRTVSFPCDLIRSLFPALNQERDSSFLITLRGPRFRRLFSTRSTVTCCMGVEILGVTAGEAAQPEKIIPRAMRTVSLRLILFYVLSMVVMLSMTPWDRMGSGITGSPFVLAFAAAGIPFVGSIMNLAVITAALSSANTNLYLITRTLFSLSRDGYVSARLGRLGRNGVPYFALLASIGGMVAAILLATFAPGRAFLLLYGVAVAGMFFVWIVILLAHLAFRRSLGQAHIALLPILLPFAPYSQIAALIALAPSRSALSTWRVCNIQSLVSCRSCW
jgi:amino acid transporter, AAT family